MSKFAGIITDLDGTVVERASNGAELPNSLATAVSVALKQGKRISCATGRGWPSTKPVITRIGIKDPCIIEGGSRIIDPSSEKTIWERFLDHGASARVLEVIKELSTGQELLKTTSNPDRIQVAEVSSVGDRNRIIYLIGTNIKTADSIVAAIDSTRLAVAYKTTPSWAGEDLYDVHITNKEGTKENAIHEWQRIMKISKEETIGIGDSENDIPLFDSVGFKIAVGNATESLKKLADYVAPRREEGALEFIIKKYLTSD